MNDIKEKLLDQVSSIVGRAVMWDEDLYSNAIDSMSLVKIINLVDDMSRELNVEINLDALVSEETLSIKNIYLLLNTEK